MPKYWNEGNLQVSKSIWAFDAAIITAQFFSYANCILVKANCVRLLLSDIELANLRFLLTKLRHRT